VLRGKEFAGSIWPEARYLMLGQRFEQPIDLGWHIHSRPGGDHHGDCLRLRPATGDSFKRRYVDPVRIIGCDKEGLLVSSRSEQRRCSGGNRRAVPASGWPDLQRACPGPRPNRWELTQQPCQRIEEPRQSSEGNPRLGLVTLNLQDAKAFRDLGGESDQLGLPNAGLAPEQQHAGRFLPGTLDKVPEQLTLLSAP
jgi:hypothetical protein